MAAILTFNAGSSSLKFALFEANGLVRLVKGEIADIPTRPHFRAWDGDGKILAEKAWPQGHAHEDFLPELMNWIEDHLGGEKPAAAGHRIVHGGPVYHRPVRIDAAVLGELAALIPLAPLHQPHNLAPVKVLLAARPHLPQIACFDTGFHHTMPTQARRFALPASLETGMIRRYGFHGLSYEYLAARLGELAPSLGKVIAAHLGNGASLCAMQDGRSIDTSMGFTALDGLVMGTRPGTLDPGLVLYLLKAKGLSPQALEEMLYGKAGLLGVSQISADMRTLLASSDPRAAEAISLFVFQAVRQIGAMAASLGGCEALVFSGGIGENASPIRARVCEGLAYLGVRLDAAANRASRLRIHAEDSRVQLFVIPTDEEMMIARHAAAMTRKESACAGHLS
jgi:acetate kinase